MPKKKNNKKVVQPENEQVVKKVSEVKNKLKHLKRL